MNPAPSKRVLEALAVTAEVLGTQISDAAALVIAQDVSHFTEEQVLAALVRVRRECRRMTLADILERIDDGRPGAEEAWAAYPKSEADSAAVTEEMMAAGAEASRLFQHDKVAARMAFIEKYRTLVARARAANVPVRWFLSLGHDPRGREAAARAAVESGRISFESVARQFPELTMSHPNQLHLGVEDANEAERIEQARERIAAIASELSTAKRATSARRES